MCSHHQQLLTRPPLCARPCPGDGGCGNRQRPSKGEHNEATYSELARARESALINCLLAETQRQAEEWESFIVKEREMREGARCVRLEAVGTGKLEVG